MRHMCKLPIATSKELNALEDHINEIPYSLCSCNFLSIRNFLYKIDLEFFRLARVKANPDITV